MRQDRQELFAKDGRLLQIGQLVRMQHCVGPYGKTAITTGEIVRIHCMPYGLTIKLSERSREVARGGSVEYKQQGESVYRSINVTFHNGTAFANHKHDDFEHGHESWVEIVSEPRVAPSPALSKEATCFLGQGGNHDR